jgi:hypothetical protein
MKIDEPIDQLERMGTIEFIEQFEKVMEDQKNYYFILEDLNNKIFPFHDRDNHIKYRRHYYWLKQHNKLKFKNLNNRLKSLVQNKIA